MLAWAKQAKRLLISPSLSRSVYIPSRVTRQSNTSQRRVPVRPQPSHDEQELDQQLIELRKKEQEIRQFLKLKQDEERQARNSKELGVDLKSRATDEDINALETDLFPSQSNLLPQETTPKFSLFSKKDNIPESIKLRIDGGSKVSDLVRTMETKQEQSWSTSLRKLAAQGGFVGIPLVDVEKFVVSAGSHERALHVDTLERMISESNIVPSQFLRDLLMSGYSANGRPEEVERHIAASTEPNSYSFGHLAKAYFKTQNFDEVLKVLDRLKELGIAPSVAVYTIVIQAFIQRRDYDGAFQVFDNMKYLSTGTLPSTKTYNSLMVAAAKQHNVMKVLDLYNEMTTRPIDPLVPDSGTFNSLIYACARDPRTHMKAWQYFIELKESGVTLTKQHLNILLYLCGSTGELLIARAIVMQLCRQAETYPDNYAVNCLFLAYLNHKPGTPSQVLGTSLGAKIRSQFMFDSTPAGDHMPPFLPVTTLTPEMVLAESTALVDYFYEKMPGILKVSGSASMSKGSTPILFNHLRIALEHGDLDTFKKIYENYTFLTRSPTDESLQIVAEECEKRPAAIVRESGTYRLALKAAIKFRSIDFGKEIWIERGTWRRTADFKNLSKAHRDQSDSVFARDMVNLFAVCGEMKEALNIVHSTSKMIRWRRHNFDLLLDICAEREDFDTIQEVKRVLRTSYEKDQKLYEA